MAKAIWAVACPLLAVLLISVLSGTGRADNTVATISPKPAKDNGAMLHGADASYRMGPEDILRVSVWENKELTLDVVVRPDGKISLPLVQDVQAEGLTAGELAEIVHKRLESFLKDPQVSIIVLQVNAPKLYVIGSVAKPGPYPLRGETSVLQALSAAGGFTQFASPRSIKLIRGSGLKQEVRKINYYKIIDEGGEGNYLLKPGDTIVIP
ncbi:MAG TPA: polysaccharide biosynthesis/export family protein [Candidatus Deferrimicrobiaceae bacterium]|jgi:polysaccharide export outer membrane protein